MLLTTAIAIFLIAWSSIFLVDYVLRVKHFNPYIRLVQRFGIEVSPFQLKFYITPKNDDSERLIKDENDDKSDVFHEASRRTKCKNLLLQIWFTWGAIVSVICLVGMTFYMSHMLYKDLSHFMSTRPKVAPYRNVEHRSIQTVLMMTSTPSPVIDMKQQEEVQNPVIVTSDDEYDMIMHGQKSSQRGLVPIIPGFNLPWSHIPIFMITLVIAGIFHELGHAWAATSNDVTVNGFGVFVLAVYPGAFTDIEQTSLKRASSFGKLKIFGGGIWHNLFLALVAMAIFHSTPVLMTPLLAEGNGVSVKAVDSRSGLNGGSTGLHYGDIVNSVDDCPITTIHDWVQCIRNADNQHNGRCVDKAAVEAATAFNTWTSSDEIHCCDEFNVTNAHVCFEREEKVIVEKTSQTHAPQLNALLGLGEEKKEDAVVEKTETKYSCLNARQVVEQSICNSSNICANTEQETVCVYPALFNGTRLVKIGLTNRRKPILFVGHLNEMLEMVSLTSRTPRFSFVNISWQDHFELAAKYLFTLSLALGLFNAIPCYALDGQFIITTLLKRTRLSLRRRELIRYIILCYGTFIMIINILIGFIKLVFL